MTPFELLLSFADSETMALAEGRLRNTQSLFENEKLLVVRDQAKLALLIVLELNPKEALSPAEQALIEGSFRLGPFRIKAHPAFIRNTKLVPKEEDPQESIG